MQCDCEANNCPANNGHVAGGCKHIPHAKVEAFGYKENLCQACLRYAHGTVPVEKFRVLEIFAAL